MAIMVIFLVKISGSFPRDSSNGNTGDNGGVPSGDNGDNDNDQRGGGNGIYKDCCNLLNVAMSVTVLVVLAILG